MNLRQLRTDVGAVAAGAGFNAWNIEPDDPEHLPAAVVGGVRSMQLITMAGGVEVELVVTFYVSTADAEDGTAVLDMVLSMGQPDSFLTALLGVEQENGPAWSSVRFVQAGPYHNVQLPGNGGVAQAVEVLLSFTA